MGTPRAARRWTHRILLRLEKLERHAAYTETVYEAEIYRLAWLTVDFASRSDPDPAGEACRVVYGASRRPASQIPFPTSAMATGIALPDEIEGRTAPQWVKAVTDYLRYRAGISWRTATQLRRDPEAEPYIAAINLINQAQVSPPPRCPVARAQSQPIAVSVSA